jgi:hypothetical protein
LFHWHNDLENIENVTCATCVPWGKGLLLTAWVVILILQVLILTCATCVPWGKALLATTWAVVSFPSPATWTTLYVTCPVNYQIKQTHDHFFINVSYLILMRTKILLLGNRKEYVHRTQIPPLAAIIKLCLMQQK